MQLLFRPLIQKLPSTRIYELPVHEFTFLDPKRFANTTSNERIPFVREYWEKLDSEYVDGPGAESFSQFYHRVRGSLRQMRDFSENDQIAVFTHGHVIKLIRMMLERADEIGDPMLIYRDRYLNLIVENSSIWKIKT